MPLERDIELKIKELLGRNRRGLAIAEIASRLGMSRSSVVKYLEVLEARGEVENLVFGNTRVYFPARRVAVQALLNLTSDLVCTVDDLSCILFANPKFCTFFGIDESGMMGRRLADLHAKVKGDPSMSDLLEDLCSAEAITKEITLIKGADGTPDRVYHLKARGIPTVFDDGSQGTTFLIEDLTAEKEYVHNLEFLARTSAELADMGDEENIYQYMADRITELAPESIIAVSSIDMESRVQRITAIGGNPEMIRGLFSGLNVTDPGEAVFSLDNTPEAEAFLNRRTLEEEAERLYIQLYRMYPEDLCDRLQERLSLGRNYGMGCVCRGGLYGAVTIRLRKGGGLRSRETIEAFIRQSGVALQRRHVREKLRKAEERVKELESS
jgi:PAS domain S-box-containing protein